MARSPDELIEEIEEKERDLTTAWPWHEYKLRVLLREMQPPKNRNDVIDGFREIAYEGYGDMIPEAYRKPMSEIEPRGRDDLLKRVWDFIYATDDGTCPGRSLFLTGGVGTGKSTIATAAAVELSIRRPWLSRPALYWANFTGLMSRLRGFDESSRAEERQWRMASVVVLDDIGAQRATDFAVETLYQICEECYSQYKVLIVTSNMSLDEIAADREAGGFDRRIASRLSVGTCVGLEFSDYRRGQ